MYTIHIRTSKPPKAAPPSSGNLREAAQNHSPDGCRFGRFTCTSNLREAAQNHSPDGCRFGRFTSYGINT